MNYINRALIPRLFDFKDIPFRHIVNLAYYGVIVFKHLDWLVVLCPIADFVVNQFVSQALRVVDMDVIP